MAECYFPGCNSHASTKEHIPPKSFFPDSKKTNLMTVKSCKEHNNEKTKDDIYVLANICLNSINNDKNDAFEVFESTVKPQLLHNNEALMKKVLRKLSKTDDGMNRFEVDSARLNSFFECLTFGVLKKKFKKKLDISNYKMSHIYLNLEERDSDGNVSQFHTNMKDFWRKNLLNSPEITKSIEFKVQNKKGYSTEIYSVRFMGADFTFLEDDEEFNASATVIHNFYENFVVISLLTRVNGFEKTPIYIKVGNE